MDAVLHPTNAGSEAMDWMVGYSLKGHRTCAWTKDSMWRHEEPIIAGSVHLLSERMSPLR